MEKKNPYNDELNNKIIEEINNQIKKGVNINEFDRDFSKIIKEYIGRLLK